MLVTYTINHKIQRVYLIHLPFAHLCTCFNTFRVLILVLLLSESDSPYWVSLHLVMFHECHGHVGGCWMCLVGVPGDGGGCEGVTCDVTCSDEQGFQSRV